MKLSTKMTGAATGLMAAFAALPAWAQEGPIKAPTAEQMATMVNKGDTTRMLVSAALVLMMSVPALALFYGGLVRTKNMLSVLMQVLTIVCGRGAGLGLLGLFDCLHQRHWRPRRYFGGLSKAFLAGVDRVDLRRHLLEQRLYARNTPSSMLPDDLRLHHAGADRRRVCRTRQVHPADHLRRCCG